jgi:hypothetical protein
MRSLPPRLHRQAGDLVQTGRLGSARRVYRADADSTGKMRGMSTPRVVHDGPEDVRHPTVTVRRAGDGRGEA